jgi:hypothetical protein
MDPARIRMLISVILPLYPDPVPHYGQNAGNFKYNLTTTKNLVIFFDCRRL